VQITYLAYTGTTGMEAMDYRLTDGAFDPPSPTNPPSPQLPITNSAMAVEESLDFIPADLAGGDKKALELNYRDFHIARICSTEWGAPRKSSRRCTRVSERATGCRLSVQSSALSPPPTTITSLSRKSSMRRTE